MNTINNQLAGALRKIAAMDERCVRADDLGRAARIAREALAAHDAESTHQSNVSKSGGEIDMPQQAAPVEPVASYVVPESAVQELCTLLEREQGVYLAHTTVSKYLSTVLKAVPKPLTEEQIKAVLTSIDPETKRLPPGFRDFARAIEAAHGIKEQAE